ncbi:MAG: Asp-tRNA(Asn)/Glu-tRNA(Gln) amidotransferase subunit GatC [Rhodospirillaceae bacterium]|jgi:aspartyl-tRNA(Asn)/glutamyl-tRNA(Gln) amidotransferase subunit C|nr:Asp-tRNA(Asn)/Glu-tRNA(Gln) amidotransferase subunit GatC [Rhodospirillaceae bacterium]MBT5298086.1 Asp-tRNA(Asn)/Glu-tRNA(Gln) amidotransferase subunit GatC [Rhodospirillaceae bacterium]MBT6086292.1 Asp-tRNA(Asn)/Glu-tRNA(Gln) amidotransferase subunit GatC [Rhodospirillaceae bacterium]MBT6608424.1 Asp-tRNA(Asn)/Glu-tRNA(Gln) amidotransferase subunit GatC [Rhodospirillaceae bacterium]MBT6886151.1 Asp-tRNA(Asn)/Glu-tRNA(Gln) amidotransferase subunit GatC [Rhodospirillaceae bacterium]
MSLDREDVRKIAFLARIKIDEAELEPLAGELNGIIGWVEQLSEVDTEGVKPMTSVAEMIAPQRVDEITDGNVAEKVLSNAPDRAKDFFAVPKVVE